MQTSRRFIDARLCIDGIAASAPQTPVAGTQFLVAANATGDFAGKDNQIAYYSAKGWKFTAPTIGQLEVFNLSDLKFYRYEATGWVAYDVASSRVKDPVVAMVTSGATAPASTPEAAGELYINTADGKVYTSVSDGNNGFEWNSGEAATAGLRYASTTDAKIHVATGSSFTEETVGDTVMFISKADDNIYAYDADSNTFRNLTSIEDNPIYRKVRRLAA